MIVAGIVTFEPDIERLGQNLDGIAGQVDKVLICDNGSSNAEAIRALAGRVGDVRVLSSSTNEGIGAALNRLAEHARTLGATSILTLDQDSVSPAGMVAELSRVAARGIPVVTPYIVDRNKLSVDEYHRLALPEIEFYEQAARRGAITSGELVDLSVWAEVGGFDEQFFIDYVDYDFNQRVLLAGHRIARANRTHLLHEVGRAVPTWLRVPRKTLSGDWRIERFYSFGHSPQRCYFKARNRILFTRKYGRSIGLTHEGAWQIPQQVALTLMFEPDRRAKLKAFARGVRDGLNGSTEAHGVERSS